MKKLMILVFSILVFLSACKNENRNTEPLKEKKEDGRKKEVKSDTIKKEKNAEISLLDSIRASMHKAYASYPHIDIDNSEDQPGASVECTPCDIDYLVYLNGKDDYNLQDIRILLCLDNDDVCDDNAEFVTFYNDIIFKVFNREKKDLTSLQIDSLLQDLELIEELQNPISEEDNINLLQQLGNIK